MVRYGKKQLVKKNLKKSFFLLVGLFLIGLIGLFLALFEFNSNYTSRKEALQLVSTQLNQLEDQMILAREKLQKYDFLEYKVSAYEKKLPDFSLVLDSAYKKSLQYGFHPDLVLSIINVESGFNPKAVSFRGAYGLMQVNLFVWKKELNIDKKRIFDIDYNIDLGLKILKRYLIEAKGNLKRALHLYNNGYKYNNTSYVKKIKSKLSDFSLTTPVDEDVLLTPPKK